MRSVDKLIEKDVLVIGGGIAGLRAAIEADEQGANIILATKVTLSSGGSIGVLYSSGVGPWGDPRDAKKDFFEDIVKAGGYLADQRLAKAFADDAGDRLLELERFGIVYDRNPDGSINAFKTGGHKYPRTIHVDQRWTGINIGKALISEIIRRDIEYMKEVMVTKLLLYNGAVVGSFGYDYHNGDFVVFKAKSTILCTGGSGQLWYPSTIHPREATGDGYSLALRAGAKLVNMEQQMYGGKAIHVPDTLKARGIATTVGGYVVHLLNANGERFMKKYAPDTMEGQSTYDVIARACYIESREGRGPIYYDLRHIPYEVLKEKASEDLMILEKFGYDPGKDLIECSPGAHTMVGGVKINERGESTVPGLYAAGSVTGGVHGGQRVGGSGSPDALVFGYRAGKYAAQRALRTKRVKLNWKQMEKESTRITEIIQREEGIPALSVKRKLQEIMWEHVPIVHDERNLNIAMQNIMKLGEDISRVVIKQKTKRFNYELVNALELPMMADVAEMKIRASMMRKESRTCFLRSDYPNRDDKNWLKNIVVELGRDNKMKFYTIPVEFTYLKPPGGGKDD